MTKDFQDLQSLDTHEEKSYTIDKRFFPSRFSFPTPTRCSVLLYGLFALCALLLSVIIIVIAVNNSRVQETQNKQLEFFSNVSLSMQSLLQAFLSTGGRMMDLEKSLKALESDRSQVGTLKEKLADLGKTLEKLESDRSRDTTLADLRALQVTVAQLRCDVERLANNDTRSWCCPEGWVTFSSSCYYFSKQLETWQNAEKDCVSKKAHLVVIETASEQDFLEKRTIPQTTWIGLAEAEDGEWQWVDGTGYDSIPKRWLPSQPDNYFHHGKGFENCAEISSVGGWNDNYCSENFKYICELKMA